MSAVPTSTTLPGFIDLQINGAFGWDFTTEPESIWDVGRRLPRFGVTAFLPTIISSSDRSRARAYAALRARPDDYFGAKPLGLHLEGPLLAESKAGVHPTAAIADGVSRYGHVVAEFVANADVVSMVTLAPELPGAVDAIERLTQSGIVVSLGHSDASQSEAVAAFDAGATAVTHVFNAMAPLHHREVGLVGAALDDPRVMIGLIADNRHVDPVAMRLIWRLVGPERIVLVTDAMAGLGAAPGRYLIGDKTIVCTDEARAETGELAGSLLDLPTAGANLRQALSIAPQVPAASPQDLLAQLLSRNQARLLAGQLPGSHDVIGTASRQDFVVLDDAFRPMVTYIDGQECWRHPNQGDSA